MRLMWLAERPHDLKLTVPGLWARNITTTGYAQSRPGGRHPVKPRSECRPVKSVERRVCPNFCPPPRWRSGRPEKISFEQMAREVVARQGEAKTVVVDSQVGYFGTPLSMNSLVTA